MASALRKSRLFALVAVLALVAAACAQETAPVTTAEPGATTAPTEPTETTAPPPETTAPPVTGGAVSTYIGEPESLITLNDNESEGIAVLRALYTQLITYDPLTSEPVLAMAESIESTDGGTTWVIQIKDGWTFHDGTPVTASSFVDAWNHGAYGPNAQQNSGFFAGIAGYEDLQCGTVTEPDPDTGEDVEVADCEGQPPASETMSGLVVDSDTQFTVTLSAPESFFLTRLGYPAYSPLPQAFYDDPAAFNEQPIGNGPFMMAGPWEHNVAIMTQAFPDYAGENQAQIDTLEFRIFDDVNTAVNELLAGNLDIVDSVPPERLPEVEGTVPNFGESPSSSINYLGFPMYDPNFGGDENQPLRAALSMAIDQTAITDAIFAGTRQPAFNLLSPVIPGYQETVCENWSFNPEMAQTLYEQHGGVDALTVYFNAGAAHEDWINAVANQWSQTLGIDINNIQFQGIQPFGDYLAQLDAQGIDGPFRLGWGMDYPHPQNYWQLLLDPDFLPPVGANNTGYSSEEFNAKLDEALAITDLEEALPVYQELAGIACEDVPLIPMFYGLNQFAWNDTVDGVYVDAFGDLVYSDLVATGG